MEISTDAAKKRLFLDGDDQLSLYHSQFNAYFSCLAGIPVINQPTNWQRKLATVLKKNTSDHQTGVQSVLEPDTINWTGVWLLPSAADSPGCFFFCLLNLFCPLWPNAAEMFFAFLWEDKSFQKSGSVHFTCSGDITVGLMLTRESPLRGLIKFYCIIQMCSLWFLSGAKKAGLWTFGQDTTASSKTHESEVKKVLFRSRRYLLRFSWTIS